MNMRLVLKSLIILIAFPFILNAEGEEKSEDAFELWRCKDNEYSEDVIITASRNGLVGKIDIAGIVQWARFSVEGFDRRWDFEPDGLRFKFSFIIEPDGTGRYYDFTQHERSRASQLYHCNK